MIRVLIGFDGSELARRASHEGLRLLGSASAQVTVLQVIQPAVSPIGMAGGAVATPVVIDDRALRESTEAAVIEAQRDLDSVLAEIGGTHERQVVVGDPGTELCRIAQDDGYDVLVVGSHGAGFVKRVLLGSVSHHVLHHAPCPVLVVRSQDEQPPHDR